MRQRTRSRRARAVIAALALATALAVAAAPASASTGSVYVDTSDNAAAGDPSNLFNATFTGGRNVGLGREVMPSLTTGSFNVATGTQALVATTTGESNIATGDAALFANTGGSNNVAIGDSTLQANKLGGGNVAEGYRALFHSTGSRNVAIGPSAGINLTNSDRNVDIANPGVAGESGKIRIGTNNNQLDTYIAGIWGNAAAGPTKAVVVNSKGKLATGPAPAAPKSQARIISRLRDRVGQLATAVQRLRDQVQNGG